MPIVVNCWKATCEKHMLISSQAYMNKKVQRLVRKNVEPKLMGLGSDGKHIKSY